MMKLQILLVVCTSTFFKIADSVYMIDYIVAQACNGSEYAKATLQRYAICSNNYTSDVKSEIFKDCFNETFGVEMPENHEAQMKIICNDAKKIDTVIL